MSFQSIAWALMSEQDYDDYLTERNDMIVINTARPPMLILSTANIAQEYAVAIINDDYSGLTDDDCAKVDKWLATLPCDHHIIAELMVTGEDIDFTRCEICGLMADCIKVSICQQ